MESNNSFSFSDSATLSFYPQNYLAIELMTNYAIRLHLLEETDEEYFKHELKDLIQQLNARFSTDNHSFDWFSSLIFIIQGMNNKQSTYQFLINFAHSKFVELLWPKQYFDNI